MSPNTHLSFYLPHQYYSKVVCLFFNLSKICICIFVLEVKLYSHPTLISSLPNLLSVVWLFSSVVLESSGILNLFSF